MVRIEDRFKTLQSQVDALKVAYQALIKETKAACTEVMGQFIGPKLDSVEDSWKASLNSEREKLLAEIMQNKQEILLHKQQLQKYEANLIGLELHIKKQEEQIQKSENFQRNTNLNIIVHVSPCSSFDNHEVGIKNIFKNIMGVNPEIRKIVCLKSINLNYSFLVELGSKMDKNVVFKNCSKLRAFNGNISILDDVSREERQRRRELSDIIRKEKQNGNIVQLRGVAITIKQREVLTSAHSGIKSEEAREKNADFSDTDGEAEQQSSTEAEAMGRCENANEEISEEQVLKKACKEELILHACNMQQQRKILEFLVKIEDEFRQFDHNIHNTECSCGRLVTSMRGLNPGVLKKKKMNEAVFNKSLQTIEKIEEKMKNFSNKENCWCKDWNVTRMLLDMVVEM